MSAPDLSPQGWPLVMRTFRLGTATWALGAALAAWFALDFVGVHRLVDREPLVSLAGLMLALLVLLLIGGLARVRYLAIPYGLSLAVWAGLQWDTHWSTFLFTASPRKLAWYERVFGDHGHLLTARPGHTTPDTYHTVLALLLLANLLLVGRDLLRRKPLDQGHLSAAPAAIEPASNIN
ncbi:MAG: hypothetical protein K1X74_08130 [Pirellulales bacterium]|nr:hypothetical protein [Pirellulales bacterium]